MRKTNNILGEFNEVLVSNFLENRGHKILKLRFKRLGGEVDVISFFQNKIIFTEVKYRNHFEDFEGVVDGQKMNRIYTIANLFLEENSYQNYDAQFDILFIDKGQNIHHLENIVWF